MEKEEIKITDIERILFGDAPREYLWEVFFRTLIIFIALIVFLRLMGKRVGGQFTISDLAVMLSLGAILSVPMQSPERGILQGCLIMITFFLLHRGLNLWEVRSRKLERITQGEPVMLVKDGVIMIDNLKKCRISNQQLFAKLRENDLYNLGKVKRVYFEAYGMFSIYKFKEDRPGLSLFPPGDKGMFENVQSKSRGLRTCCNCGNTVEGNEPQSCEICENKEWADAVI